MENVIGRNFNPEEEVERLKRWWSWGDPTAFGVIFRSDEKQVADFLQEKLVTQFAIKSIDLKKLLTDFSESGSNFFNVFFQKESGIRDEAQEEVVYLFQGADELDDREIEILSFAADPFERDGNQADFIRQHKIYPLILLSTNSLRRYLNAPGGNIRKLKMIDLRAMT